MQKNNIPDPPLKKKLVLRKQSIKSLDHANLMRVAGGESVYPPTQGPPPEAA